MWRAAPGWTVGWGAALVIQGVLPGAMVYLTRWLVDSLVAAVDQGGAEAIRPVLIPAAILLGLMLLTTVLDSFIGWLRLGQAERIQDYISGLIHHKAAQVDLAFYESPAYHDLLERVRREVSQRPLALLENLGGLGQNSLTMLTLAAVLLPYGAWLPVVLFLSALPAFYVVIRFNWRHHLWWQQRTPDRREAAYYDLLLTWDMAVPELRLFNLGGYFRQAYQVIRQSLREERLELAWSQALSQLAAGLMALIISGAVIGWMAWRALHGAATLGDVALFYQAFSRGQGLMQTLLGNVAKVYTNSLFLSHLFEFLALEPQVVDPPQPAAMPAPPTTAIRFERVTFFYPGSRRAALQDFDLVIPARQITAIVGSNGAGKSTLVKLLGRFYDPQAGRILLDGVDLCRLTPAEVRRQLTILFQMPMRYQTTAAQNIAISDLEARPGPEQIEAAARGAGAHQIIASLPWGYETRLGKWFSQGVELSLGEWQRVTLARTFLRQAPVIILDEPTSFMDSWAEAEWLNRFRALTAGKTVLIITHRLTTARRADTIHVMDRGRIIESGSHQELLAQKGRYAESWTRQAGVSSPD